LSRVIVFSWTHRIVHSKLDYCNSLYYNLPKSQINRLQQIQNCLACTVVKAPKSSQSYHYHTHPHYLCTGSINERIEYKLLSGSHSHSHTKFLQPANLTTYRILSLFSLHVEPAPHPLSPSLDHPYLLSITGCAVAQHCCNDDQQSQWENGDFDPPVDLKPLKILLQKLDTLITLRGATSMPNFIGIKRQTLVAMATKFGTKWVIT